MNVSQEYVGQQVAELRRLRAREMEVIEKLVNHFESTDHGLHERYMRLDTENAKLKEQVREIEERVRLLEERWQ